MDFALAEPGLCLLPSLRVLHPPLRGVVGGHFPGGPGLGPEVVAEVGGVVDDIPREADAIDSLVNVR